MVVRNTCDADILSTFNSSPNNAVYAFNSIGIESNVVAVHYGIDFSVKNSSSNVLNIIVLSAKFYRVRPAVGISVVN